MKANSSRMLAFIHEKGYSSAPIKPFPKYSKTGTNHSNHSPIQFIRKISSSFKDRSDNHSQVRCTMSLLPMGGQRIIHDNSKIVASMLQKIDFKLSFWWCAHLVIGHRAHSCQAKALVATHEKNHIQDIRNGRKH